MSKPQCMAEIGILGRHGRAGHHRGNLVPGHPVLFDTAQPPGLGHLIQVDRRWDKAEQQRSARHRTRLFRQEARAAQRSTRRRNGRAGRRLPAFRLRDAFFRLPQPCAKHRPRFHGKVNRRLFRRHPRRFVRQRMRQMRQHLARADLQEIGPLALPVRQDARRPCGCRSRRRGARSGRLQLRLPMRVADGTGDQAFEVHEVLGHAVGIIDIGHAPGHPGAKVGADAAQNHRHPAGHVFAAVRPAALDHHRRARVAHAQTVRPRGPAANR